MKRTLLILTVLTLIGQSGVMAQDFNALLKAVDEVEANLKALVNQETAARQQESQKLRAEMKQTQTAPGVASDNPMLAQMAEEMKALKAEVAQLRSQPGQPTVSEGDLAGLVSDITALKAELATLRASNDESQKLLASLDGEGAYAPENKDAVLDQIYQKLGAINDQLSNMKPATTPEVKPGFQVNWYGQVKLDASWDQNPTSHGNYVMWVKSQASDKSDAQFNITHRATRFGFRAKSVGFNNITMGGNLEIDLYGGGEENKALLLLRHAYFTIQSGRIRMLAGQSWDLIAPLNPATLNYPVLWGAGNIQYRRPQVSLFYSLANSEQTKAELAAGFFRTLGSDLTPTFALATGETSDGTEDGSDAAVPSIQSSFDLTHKFASGMSVRGGVSGLWGSLKSETNLDHSENYESWAACAHLMVSWANGAGFSGEVFTGSNLGSYLGGIVNTNRIDGLAAIGGWASAWVKLHKKVTLTAGCSVDDPKDEDLNAAERSQNQAIFGNLKYAIAAPVTFGVELSRWQTKYVDAESANATRLETSFIMSF